MFVADDGTMQQSHKTVDSLTPAVVLFNPCLEEMLRLRVASTRDSTNRFLSVILLLLLGITASSADEQSPWKGKFLSCFSSPRSAIWSAANYMYNELA